MSCEITLGVACSREHREMGNTWKKEKEFTHCALCGADDYTTLYPALDIKISLQWFPIVRCNSCGLVYTNPRPPEKNIKAYYGSKYYSYQTFPANKESTEMANSGKKVLDVGCGSGNWLYHQRLLGHDVYGVEIDSGAVTAGRRMELSIFQGRLTEAGFESEFFDYIRMNHVLEHVYSPLETLREVRRILKNDGTLFVEVHNFDSVESFLLRATWRQLEVPRHLWHFSPHTLEKLLREAGLRITQKKMKPFPDSFKAIGTYLRCQYTTVRLIFQRLKKEKKRTPSFLLFFASISVLGCYLIKYWMARLSGRVRPDNESLIQYECMPDT